MWHMHFAHTCKHPEKQESFRCQLWWQKICTYKTNSIPLPLSVKNPTYFMNLNVIKRTSAFWMVLFLLHTIKIIVILSVNHCFNMECFDLTRDYHALQIFCWRVSVQCKVLDVIVVIIATKLILIYVFRSI